MAWGVQIQLKLEKPINPPDVDPISAQTEAPVGRWGVSNSKNWRQRVEWQVCFSKTWATQTRPSYTKIKKNLIEPS